MFITKPKGIINGYFNRHIFPTQDKMNTKHMPVNCDSKIAAENKLYEILNGYVNQLQ